MIVFKTLIIGFITGLFLLWIYDELNKF